ncbi:MAG: PEGA domain-containing protein [Spirochaetia bacterium]|nr:PEGA domain-containing protein [Spirochaetia bacterium]
MHRHVGDPHKNRFAYKDGYIQYKSEYTLFMFPPFYTVPEKNKYIRDIYSSIVLDQLQLNRVIYIKDPAPIAISYPENITQEDPYEKFMSGEVPAPKYFDFQTKMIYNFPAEINDPAKILSEPALSRFFLPEDLYLVSSIEEQTVNQKEIYTIYAWIYRNGKLIFNHKVSSKEEDLSKNLIMFAREISTGITGAETGSLSIKSNIDRASIYINDHYTGYTPLLIKNAILGENSVIIRKEGYEIWEQTVLILKDKTVEITANLEKVKTDRKVTVTTSPEQCDVFFDVEYKGQTPLVINNVSAGTHRIHIQKGGYIDYFNTIYVDNEKQEYSVSAKLAKGETKKYYDINRAILGPLNYEQLFKISAAATVISGLAGIFSQVQQENMQINLNQYLNSNGADALLITKQKNEIQTYSSLKTVFYVGTGVFTAATIYFFINFTRVKDMPISSISNGLNNQSQVTLDINPFQNAFQIALQRRF